jgi:hypothetical protein
VAAARPRSLRAGLARLARPVRRNRSRSWGSLWRLRSEFAVSVGYRHGRWPTDLHAPGRAADPECARDGRGLAEVADPDFRSVPLVIASLLVAAACRVTAWAAAWAIWP